MERRTLIKACSASVPLATTGLAGCSGLSQLGGGDGGSAAARKWLPEPGDVTESDHYRVANLEPKALAKREDGFAESVYGNFKSFTAITNPSTGQRVSFEDTFEVDFDETSSLLAGYGFQVVNANFEKKDLKETLDDENFDDEDKIGSYEPYVHDAGVAVGVGDGTFIATRKTGGEDAESMLETVIETKNGEGNRYVGESDALEALLGALGGGAYYIARTHEAYDETKVKLGRFENAVGWGGQISPGEDSATTKWVIAFESADDVAKDDVKTWTDEAMSDFENVTVSTSGKVATVTAARPVDEVEAYSEVPKVLPIERSLPDPEKYVAENASDNERGTTTVQISAEFGELTMSEAQGEDYFGDYVSAIAGYLDADDIQKSHTVEDHDAVKPEEKFIGLQTTTQQDTITFDSGTFRGIAVRATRSIDLQVDYETVARDVTMVRYSPEEGVIEKQKA